MVIALVAPYWHLLFSYSRRRSKGKACGDPRLGSCYITVTAIHKGRTNGTVRAWRGRGRQKQAKERERSKRRKHCKGANTHKERRRKEQPTKKMRASEGASRSKELGNYLQHSRSIQQLHVTGVIQRVVMKLKQDRWGDQFAGRAYQRKNMSSREGLNTAELGTNLTTCAFHVGKS